MSCVCGKYRVRGREAGGRAAASGGWERVVGSTDGWVELVDGAEGLLRVEDVERFEECAPRDGVIVTLLLRLWL